MPGKLTAVKTADIIHKNSGRSFLAVFLDIARSYSSMVLPLKTILILTLKLLKAAKEENMSQNR